jgi:hypothetical protein
MQITPQQFEKALFEALEDHTHHFATKEALSDLTDAVDGLAGRLSSFLDTEWIVHRRLEHIRLRKRLKALETSFRSVRHPNPPPRSRRRS